MDEDKRLIDKERRACIALVVIDDVDLAGYFVECIEQLGRLRMLQSVLLALLYVNFGLLLDLLKTVAIDRHLHFDKVGDLFE